MPKRIVLLSDGTGNAASKVWKSNVWRIFESLDLRGSDQIAFYDDGVGTSSFKPLDLPSGGEVDSWRPHGPNEGRRPAKP